MRNWRVWPLQRSVDRLSRPASPERGVHTRGQARPPTRPKPAWRAEFRWDSDVLVRGVILIGTERQWPLTRARCHWRHVTAVGWFLRDAIRDERARTSSSGHHCPVTRRRSALAARTRMYAACAVEGTPPRWLAAGRQTSGQRNGVLMGTLSLSDSQRDPCGRHSSAESRWPAMFRQTRLPRTCGRIAARSGRESQVP